MLTACLSSIGTPDQRKVEDIPAPPEYVRAAVVPGGFAAWLRQLPLKQDLEIRLHTGAPLIDHSYNLLAVINKPLYFWEDIEQCIDFCLRLWADYHYESGLLDRLTLYSFNGDKVSFTQFSRSSLAISDPATAYTAFLKAALTWSNPYTVTRGAERLQAAKARPGDCIIQTVGRVRGQASLILDQCTDNGGHHLYLMGFGFSPAQEFHIEKAPDEYGREGWFSLEGYFRYLETYYGDFGKPRLFRL